MGSRLQNCSPEFFPDARLGAADFDNTAADTFSPAPSGIGVPEAFEIAIDGLHGPAILERYRQSGGMRNRATEEVITELFPELAYDKAAQKAQELTDAKLHIMLDQIDERWPIPIAGFAKCWSDLHAARDAGMVRVDTAIISAGYQSFIRKTFEVWGLAPPDILITTETINGVDPPLPPDQRHKPAPLSMQLALSQWLGMYDIPEAPQTISDAARRVVYAGDDPYKDGKLAEHFGIPFVLVSRDTGEESWRAFATRLGLGAVSLQGVAGDE